MDEFAVRLRSLDDNHISYNKNNHPFISGFQNYYLYIVCLKGSILPLKGSIREKLKGVKAYGEKLLMVIATNFTSICCVYKKKILKND